MKYIKKIILENFQSHKYSVIELDERMNVIVGPSDSGKSAIIRGLKWVLFNEPSGTYFIREGEKECSVTIEFNDRTSLKRIRSKTKNSYILINNSGEEITFEGFGSTIPTEIIEAIGIKKIYLDSSASSYINLGEQLEGPFLLSEKTSTRASAIGRLVGVNIVDEALREVLKDIRALNISRKSLEDNNTALKNEIEAYAYLNDIRESYDKAREIESNIKKKSDLLNKLKTHKVNIVKVKEENLNLTKILQDLNSINNLEQAIVSIDNKIIKHRYINNYAKNLKEVKKGIDFNSKIMNDLKGIKKIDHIVNKLEKNNLNYKSFISILNNHQEIRTGIQNMDLILNKLKGIDRSFEYLDEIIENIENYNKLKIITSKYMNIHKSIVAGNEYIEKLAEVEIADGIYESLSTRLKRLEKHSDIYGVFIKYSNEIKKEMINLNSINKNIADQLSKYEIMLKNIEVCPFCLSDIDEEKINHILNHYIGG